MKAVFSGIGKAIGNSDSIDTQELKKQIQNPDNHNFNELTTSLEKFRQKNISTNQEMEIFDFLTKELFKCTAQAKEKKLFDLLRYWLLKINGDDKRLEFLSIMMNNQLLLALINNNKLEFVHSLLETIQYLSLLHKCNYLNSLLNSYTRISDDSLITPLMLASHKNDIDLILLLKDYGAIESLYRLEDKEIPEITAFQSAFCSILPKDSRIKTAFYLWLNGAVMKLKIDDYIHSPLSLTLSGSLTMLSLLWLEYLLTHNQFSHIDNENLYNMNRGREWGASYPSTLTPYKKLSSMLENIDKNSALYKKGQDILSLFEKKGADIDGIIPTKPQKSDPLEEFHLVGLCAKGDLKAVETYLKKKGKKINFFHYINTPAFIAAIMASKQPELRNAALKILDLLYAHDSSCARYATRQGTMAVTQAALQGDRELLEKLILNYKLPVNPICAEHNFPVNELLQVQKKQQLSKQKFAELGFKDCLALLIQHGSCVEKIIITPNLSAIPTRQYILEQKIFDEKHSENLQIDTNQPVTPEKLLLHPNLMSAIRANPIQTFIYSRWLRDYMKIDAMQNQKFATEQEHLINNCIDHDIFSISDLCDLIGSYAASSIEEKHQGNSGPNSTFFTEHRAEVRRKDEARRQKEEEKEEEQKNHAKKLAKRRSLSHYKPSVSAWEKVLNDIGVNLKF